MKNKIEFYLLLPCSLFLGSWVFNRSLKQRGKDNRAVASGVIKVGQYCTALHCSAAKWPWSWAASLPPVLMGRIGLIFLFSFFFFLKKIIGHDCKTLPFGSEIVIIKFTHGKDSDVQSHCTTLKRSKTFFFFFFFCIRSNTRT